MSETTTYGERAFRRLPRCEWVWSMEPPTVVPRTVFHNAVAPNVLQRFMQRWLLGIYWERRNATTKGR